MTDPLAGWRARFAPSNRTEPAAPRPDATAAAPKQKDHPPDARCGQAVGKRTSQAHGGAPRDEVDDCNATTEFSCSSCHRPRCWHHLNDRCDEACPLTHEHKAGVCNDCFLAAQAEWTAIRPRSWIDNLREVRRQMTGS